MLVGFHNGMRVGADVADRNKTYVCPSCKRTLVLKRGRIVIAHFAHKPPTKCAWARGETLAHMTAKNAIRTVLLERGLQSEVEFEIRDLPGDRRADVMVWSPKGIRVAIELQHTTIGLESLEARAFSYARGGIAQIWIPFLRGSVWDEYEKCDDGTIFVERYPARPYERWIHGFHAGRGMWMYEPKRNALWRANLSSHPLHVKGPSWYPSETEEQWAGDYYRFSKRFRELRLRGPYDPRSLRLTTRVRPACATTHHKWPAGRVAEFVTTLPRPPRTFE